MFINVFEIIGGRNQHNLLNYNPPSQEDTNAHVQEATQPILERIPLPNSVPIIDLTEEEDGEKIGQNTGVLAQHNGKRCYTCKATETSVWRRKIPVCYENAVLSQNQNLCNACGLDWQRRLTKEKCSYSDEMNTEEANKIEQSWGAWVLARSKKSKNYT